MAKRKCGVADCDELHLSKGYCAKHYQQMRRTGGLLPPPKRANETSTRQCSIKVCERGHYGRGWCAMHWKRWYKFGDPLARAPRGPGYRGGTVTPDGYRRRFVKGRGIRGVHRLVMEEFLGRELTPVESVHHRNGNRLDNRIENLELWSSSQPPGQRVEDKVEWAIELLEQYRPHLLASHFWEAVYDQTW